LQAAIKELLSVSVKKYNYVVRQLRTW